MPSIRKRNDKWQVQVRRQGQPSVSRSFYQRKDAEAWARQMEVRADKGELPQQVDKKVLKHITLCELVERYRDEISPGKRGGECERIILKAFLRHPLCRKSIADITPQDFSQYRDERLRVIKPASLCRQLAPIQNLFEVAKREWGLPLSENPLAHVRLDKKTTRRERRLRPGEWEKLVEIASGPHRNPLVLQVMRFALETAMRRGEILGMHWDHIAWENRCLLIPVTKNGEARTIPLSPTAIEILQGLPSDNSCVFPISANAFRLSWQRIKAKAEIDDLRFHDLRHEAISRFFELGLSVPEVALISGHKDARMLFRYTHPMRQAIHRKLRVQKANGS